jgi:hypothetical protein
MRSAHATQPFADRGFGRVEWAAVWQELEFHYVVRIKPDVTISCSRFRGVLRKYPVRGGIAHVLRDVDHRKDGRVRHNIVIHWKLGLPKKRGESWFLMTDLDGRAEKLCSLSARRTSIELFFKELKSTLGFHQYQFRKFGLVEARAERALTAFMYREYDRVQQMSRRDLSDEAKRWWQHQRTYGRCQAVRSASDQNELRYLADCLKTPRGTRTLRRLIANAFPEEYRAAS